MHRLVFVLFALAWLIAAAMGLAILLNYESTPGPSASASQSWPAASHLTRLSGRPTLVVLAHPRCPCTRATLGELARILAHCPSRLTTYVVFYKPEGTPAGWEKTDTYYFAANIPGVHVVSDVGGVEAHAFHAMTSGQTFLYDSDGYVLFSGGITAGRGHQGDSAGEAAILKGVFSSVRNIRHMPVFGCSIF